MPKTFHYNFPLKSIEFLALNDFFSSEFFIKYSSFYEGQGNNNILEKWSTRLILEFGMQEVLYKV